MVSGENQHYKELQQSTTKSWLGKTQIMTILTQTQDNQMIHPRNSKEMRMPRIKLLQQWKRRNHAILEQTNMGQQEAKGQRHHPHAKKTTQAELTQYVTSHPEMPEEMELNREDRKQMAELTLEYPPGGRSQELTQQEETPPERKRGYTRLDVSRPFRSEIGKFNRTKRHPECKNASLQETCENQRDDCSRAFKSPVNLRGNQKFVCADIREKPPAQENQKREKTQRETEQKQQSQKT